MSTRRLIPLLVALLLSACAESGIASLFGRTADPEPGVGLQQVDLSAQGTEQPGEPASASVDPRQASVTGSQIDDNPRQLVGLGPSSLAERLGSPGFVRRDGPAEVWQYAAEACILDVFLYREGDAFKVSYVALRGRGAAEQSRQECFAGMLRSRAAQHRG